MHAGFWLGLSSEGGFIKLEGRKHGDMRCKLLLRNYLGREKNISAAQRARLDDQVNAVRRMCSRLQIEVMIPALGKV